MRLNLTFTLSALVPLIEHARAATERRPTFDQLFEGRYRKDGKDFPLNGAACPKEEEVDRAKLPPCLWVVKDDGAYLMSNGSPPLRVAGPDSGAVVVYAHGYGKGCEHIGGDDFVDALPISDFEEAIAAGAKTITLVVTDRSISLRY